MQGVLLCLLTALFGGPAARAQQPVLETPEQTNERIRAFSIATQKVHREYVIGPGDLLSVEVFDVEELTRDTRVSQTGKIALPLIPIRLHVAGLTEIQTEQKLAEVLEANGLVSHPQVSVTVKEKKSKPITVVGAVTHPMVYQAERQVTLLEVLSEAGGIANDAGTVVIVTRAAPDPQADSKARDTAAEAKGDAASDPDGTSTAAASSPGASADGSAPVISAPETAALPPTRITIGLSDLLEDGDLKNNIVLQAGDIVTVPHAGIVYVIGAVERPGGFVLSNDRAHMSTLKVLSLAGGLRRTASAERAVIIRKDALGHQQQVAVNLKKVLARKSEDVTLNPSDILFIPESGGKRVAIKAAEIALALGSAAAVFRLAQP
jgi:polysaccharide biosynthesis/export protein